MKKRILVLGIALVLVALVAGFVFAATNTNGVIWVVIEGKSSRLGRDQNGNYYIEVYNSNDFKVECFFRGVSPSSTTLKAGETRHFNCTKSAELTSASRSSSAY